MARIISAVIVGFIVWLVVWLGCEAILSALLPDSFGANQRAFQSALENGTPFTADTSLLLIQLVLGSVAAVVAGYVAAMIARENRRAPLILGVMLVVVAVLKVVMSWALVPVWHHVLFTAMLLPMTLIGGRRRASNA